MAGVRRIRSPASTPLLVLALVSALSLGARALMLGEPCQSPCTHASQHTLIFDEAYYVNAARVIAGIRPAAGSHYAQSPLGTDPNAEHPQGAKLIMAAAIKIFGDGPFAWRIGSLLFGSLAILGMYALVRWSGGGRWTAVGAATLMAADNLMLVHSRIATLDIYSLAMMVWGVALYMRGSPWLAGVALAIADCFKEIAPYALLVIALVEVLRVAIARREVRAARVEGSVSVGRVGVGGGLSHWSWRPALMRFGITAVTSVALFIAGLELMGLIATPYADGEHRLITGGALDHLWHMITYASALTSPNGPQGIASYPWQWLLDLKPITYLRINPSLPGNGLYAIHPVSAFLGMISPPIIAVAIPAMVMCAYRFVRRRVRTRPDPPADARSLDDVQLAMLGPAWFVATWLPFELQSALDSRISYLYYMIVVMPGIYVSLAYVMSLLWRRRNAWLRGLVAAWGLTVIAAAVLMYPFVAAF